MIAQIEATFRIEGNTTTLTGYVVVAGGEVIGRFQSHYQAMVFIMDSQTLRLV